MFRVMRNNRWVTFDCYDTLVNRASWPVIQPFADVEPLLAELRLRGYRLGVLTNCSDAKFEATHRAFARPFDLFVTSDRIRAAKPEPWHFRAFQLMSQVRKEDWVHIASDWREDIVPAAALGVQRVWLDRSRTGEDPSRATAHVHTAAEAVRAVDWLFRDRSVLAS